MTRNITQFNVPGSQDSSGFNADYAGNQGAYSHPIYAVPTESRAPVSHQRTSMGYVTPQPHSSQPQNDMRPQHARTLRSPDAAPAIIPSPSKSFSSSQLPPLNPTSRNRNRSHSTATIAAPTSGRSVANSLFSTSAISTSASTATAISAVPSSINTVFPFAFSAAFSFFPCPSAPHYDPSHERRNAYIHHSTSPSSQEYHHTPVFPQSQPQPVQYAPAPNHAPTAAPVPDAASILRQHELEFTRTQEEMRERFKREQEEHFKQFLLAQEKLKKQLLPEGGRS
ncbi:hypothetical protein RHS01_04804 [Rhizoctonia solani]|uniref:Uncharacterized protein n=1 Tax=Rhizoctonia solani TaxID=456999 RepID=A0A8H7ICV8_9AGAM|nr:hypothetical protein RHS01_04804 [Rhizoctonia solani]